MAVDDRLARRISLNTILQPTNAVKYHIIIGHFCLESSALLGK